MSKWGKRLLGLAAIGGAAAGLAYYLKKSDYSEDDFLDDMEDEDFDLDNDLKPVTDREYVPLNPSVKSEAETVADKAAEAVETVAEKAADTAEAVAEAVEDMK